MACSYPLKLSFLGPRQSHESPQFLMIVSVACSAAPLVPTLRLNLTTHLGCEARFNKIPGLQLWIGASTRSTTGWSWRSNECEGNETGRSDSHWTNVDEQESYKRHQLPGFQYRWTILNRGESSFLVTFSLQKSVDLWKTNMTQREPFNGCLVDVSFNKGSCSSSVSVFEEEYRKIRTIHAATNGRFCYTPTS